MDYYLGIDGGGTKTAFECYTESNELVAQIVQPTCHLLQVSEDMAETILSNGIAQIQELIDFQAGDDELYVCYGLAGYGLNSDLKSRIETVCQETSQGLSYIVCNDAEVALEGALAGKDGVLLIAGTGSISLAKCGTYIRRCGGWGYQVGDEGSSYWVGKELVREFTRQSDHRSNRTLLYSYLKEKFDLNQDGDLIQVLAKDYQDRQAWASLAQDTSYLVDQGDPAAQGILKVAADHLADLVLVYRSDFPQEAKIVYIGGLLSHSDQLRNYLAERLPDTYTLMPPLGSPAYGASQLARRYIKS